MNTDLKQLKSFTQQVVDGVQKRGVAGVRAVSSNSRRVSVGYRKQRPEKVQEASSQSLALQLYDDGRYASCQTSDFRPEGLPAFLDTAVAMCRAMAPDKDRTLPSPALYENRPKVDLQVNDASLARLAPQDRHQIAAAIEAKARELAGKQAIETNGDCEDSHSVIYQINSNGFEGTRETTQFWTYGSITLRDEGERRPAGWHGSGARMRADLASPEDVAAKTVEVAQARLAAQRISTRKTVMIAENRAARRLVGFLIRAASARSIHRKESFLEGRLGKSVADEMVTLIDNPLLPRGLGSRLFDGEGISAKQMPVIEQGVLKNCYVGAYYGRKLGMAPTTGGTSNLIMDLGDKNLDQLIAEAGNAVLVRGFLGGNSNPTTGDFSLGVYGTLIENGKPKHAVAEMNIAGRLQDLWQRLVVIGNDPDPSSNMLIPSLVFDDVQFAGA
jgi:PmbA protein